MSHSVAATVGEALARVHGAETLDPDAFLRHPVVIDRLTQLKFAYEFAVKPGLALEFGVFKGTSLRALAQHDKVARFTGFDSFAGLPEAWHRSPTSTYEAGHFALPRLPLVPANVDLVQGFFDDTLADWLAANQGPVGFLHIDVDLYSSARHVLDLLTDRLVDGAVVVFDELGDWKDEGVYPFWREGEWRALEEWLRTTGMRFRILSRGTRFEAAIQVFRQPPKPMGPAEELAFATRLWTLGAKDAAVAVLSALTATRPNWLAGFHRLAQWQTQSRRVDAALSTIATIWAYAQQRPDHPSALDLFHLRATNKLRQNDLAGAEADIRHFLGKRPAHATGLALLGSIAAKNHDHKTAARAWADAFDVSGLESHRERAETERILAEIRPEFAPMRSSLLMQHLVDDRSFVTVLDVGSGAGAQADVLRRHGKRVTEVDYGNSYHFEANSGADVVRGDFMQLAFETQFDCVLASHVLEHQPNVQAFLRKLHSHLKEGGVLAISVPPLKHEIVGGHVSLWNAGLVLYNLVLAGFDCRQPWIRQYGYNISVVVEKRTIDPTGVVYDKGDIDLIAPFLPDGFKEGFNGDIRRLG